MLFNSLRFLLIFPLIFGIHWAIPARYNQWRNFFLILASYLLYMNWKPAYALVLLGVTLITFCGGYLLDNQNNTNKRKYLVWFFALLGLLPLLVFKYYNFLNDSLSAGLATIGLKFALPGLNWAVPVGISFFTFQAVGYMLDVYHGRTKAEKSFIDYLLFVSFFPQIASGPINKADELLPQIKKERTFDYYQAVSGLKYLLWGMFLKVVIADRAGIYVDTVFGAYEKFSGLGCIMASFLYSIQIYTDFAGYSLMAVGIGKILGFNLINNFRRPYFAATVTEFWKRWHISLTRWLRDYLYIPLGGNRVSKQRTYVNLFLVMFASGVWHGAAMTFICWGLYHAFFMIVERFNGKQALYSKAPHLAQVLLTQVIVLFGWVLFRAPDISTAVHMWGSMLGLMPVNPADPILSAEIFTPTTIVFMAIAFIFAVSPFRAFDWCQKISPVRTIVSFALFAFAVLALFTQTYNPFLYFQF